MTGQFSLTNEEAFELLSYMITSARGLITEPKEYGPRRLLVAAEKLAGFLLPWADEDTRPFLQELQEHIKRLFPLPDNDKVIETLDICCEMTAKELVRQTLRQGEHMDINDHERCAK